MILNIQDDILKLHSMGLLDKLLLDKTTGKRIMWATDVYSALGTQYSRNEEITPELITGPNANIIKTRARKELEQQSSRTRQRGEVFTPLWVCRKMCDHADEMWDSKARWQKYVDARVLEITCGEAPFLVSRYDVETGEAIPVPDRIGLLDRKLRAVNENAQTEEEWLKWAFRAFHATYGYEFQGDNLLIARVNLLMTFEEYLLDRWKRKPTLSEFGKLVTVIVWNIWQMDGLQGTIPYGTAEEEFRQFNLFEFLDGMSEPDEENKQPRCRAYNWLGGGSVEYSALPTRGKRAMKFDFVIGNPPYQEKAPGTSTSDIPVYHLFMDAVFDVSQRVELITPARFLFDAGATPTVWNKKMLADPHFKVLHYEMNTNSVFPTIQIPGGIVITYRDASIYFGAIGQFTPFEELIEIDRKVSSIGEPSLNTIMYTQCKFNLDALYADYPEMRHQIGNEGKDKRFRQIVMERFPHLFKKEATDDCIRTLGLINRKRAYRYILRRYVEQTNWLDSYKVFVPFSNGASGTLGEEAARIISKPVLGLPEDGITQTFIGVGAFNNEDEANHLLKYINTKFARVLLGILKVTQGNKPETWAHVPMQDFSTSSDIDWTRSIPEIDQQLYKKYGLDETEIQFIETHVKEMT